MTSVSYKIWTETKIGSVDVATIAKLEISMAGDTRLMVCDVSKETCGRVRDVCQASSCI